MFISIVIPVYKVEPYIVRCIESVLCQTCRNLEVILVDDCSPDRSMELAKGCIEQSPLSKDLSFVYLRHDHNRGLSAARNTGIDAATGDYLYFLDSDDEILIDCVECLALVADNNNFPDIVCGSFERILGEDRKERQLQDVNLSCNSDIIKFYTSNKSYMMAWNKMVKLDFLKENKLYFKEGLIHEDDLWSYLAVNKANSFSQISTATYRYYQNPNTIMTANSQLLHHKNRMTILDELNSGYINSSIKHCNANKIYIARQKVYYLEAAMLGGLPIFKSLWHILISHRHRFLFLYEFVSYFSIVLLCKLKASLKKR